MEKLEEVKRRELVNQSKHNPRFKRRLKCRLPSNSSSYENIDMNKLFKDDILEAKINVVGETDTYQVIVSFQNVLEELRQLLEQKGPTINLNIVIRAVVRAFDRNDVYIHCSCPDFKYRFNYWATIDRYNSGDPEMRPTEITNPNGNLGSCCKHGLLVLNKQIWILKVASVLNNYIKYMRLRNQNLYHKLMEPKLFGKDGEPDPTPDEVNKNQLSFFDDDDDNEEDSTEVVDTKVPEEDTPEKEESTDDEEV